MFSLPPSLKGLIFNLCLIEHDMSVLNFTWPSSCTVFVYVVLSSWRYTVEYHVAPKLCVSLFKVFESNWILLEA